MHYLKKYNFLLLTFLTLIFVAGSVTARPQVFPTLNSLKQEIKEKKKARIKHIAISSVSTLTTALVLWRLRKCSALLKTLQKNIILTRLSGAIVEPQSYFKTTLRQALAKLEKGICKVGVVGGIWMSVSSALSAYANHIQVEQLHRHYQQAKNIPL
jgi:uncharacterized protein with PQ loop repeat